MMDKSLPASLLAATLLLSACGGSDADANGSSEPAAEPAAQAAAEPAPEPAAEPADLAPRARQVPVQPIGQAGGDEDRQHDPVGCRAIQQKGAQHRRNRQDSR